MLHPLRSPVFVSSTAPTVFEDGTELALFYSNASGDHIPDDPGSRQSYPIGIWNPVGMWKPVGIDCFQPEPRCTASAGQTELDVIPGCVVIFRVPRGTIVLVAQIEQIIPHSVIPSFAHLSARPTWNLRMSRGLPAFFRQF